MRAGIEAYLAELRRALALYPGRRADVLDEVCDHLESDRERRVARGADPAAAEAAALEAFGPARELAGALLLQRSRARSRVLVPAALALGAALAWIDARPSWDDTGVSAFLVVLATALLGALDATRPWRWALLVGAWFPLLSVLQHRSPAAALALAFAAAGALGGRLARRLAAA